MNIKKIEVNNYFVWVDTEEEIEKGDFICAWELGVKDTPNWIILKSKRPELDNTVDKTYKIIAASPELNLEDVPAYPDMTTMEMIEKATEEYWYEKFEEEKLRFAINTLKSIAQPNGYLLENKIKLEIEKLEQRLLNL